jgi:hypothetical protein
VNFPSINPTTRVCDGFKIDESINHWSRQHLRHFIVLLDAVANFLGKTLSIKIDYRETEGMEKQEKVLYYKPVFYF